MVAKTIGFDGARFSRMAGYSKYTKEVYDQNIRVVPGYELLHKCLAEEIEAYARAKPIRWTKHFHIGDSKGAYVPTDDSHVSILDLGVGTGHSSEVAIDSVNSARGFYSLTGIELLSNMYDIATRRLAGRAGILHRDYFKFVSDVAETIRTHSALWKLHSTQDIRDDIVLSIISVHHVADETKAALIRDVFELLKPGGIFILGDLMTFADAAKAAAVTSKAEANLIANATSEKIREEWLTHWRELNILGTVEDHLRWFAEAGFIRIRHVFEKLTTNMIVGTKPG